MIGMGSMCWSIHSFTSHVQCPVLGTEDKEVAAIQLRACLRWVHSTGPMEGRDDTGVHSLKPLRLGVYLSLQHSKAGLWGQGLQDWMRCRSRANNPNRSAGIYPMGHDLMILSLIEAAPSANPFHRFTVIFKKTCNALGHHYRTKLLTMAHCPKGKNNKKQK